MGPLKLLAVLQLAVTMPVVAQNVQRQPATEMGALQAQVVLSKLHDPVYPTSSAIAAIQGDVKLILRITGDGAIQSVELVSGSPMLQRAAIESAQASQFECEGCNGTPQLYSLTYEFQIVPTNPEQYCSGATDDLLFPAKVDLSLHTVTVFAKQVWTCDQAVERHKARSFKCLYLWKCGFRDVAPKAN